MLKLIWFNCSIWTKMERKLCVLCNDTLNQTENGEHCLSQRESVLLLLGLAKSVVAYSQITWI